MKGLVAGTALLAIACGVPSLEVCSRHPPAGANYGTCEAVIGYYFDPAERACLAVSGCGCDPSCTDEVPFRTEGECFDTCAGFVDPR